MGATVGPLVDQLQRRLRDTGAIAQTDAVVFRALTHAQGLIAIGMRAHTETFTFTSQADRLFYNVPNDINSRIILPRTVQADNRDLGWVPYKSFSGVSRGWFRETGERYLAWSLVGRDILVLYPAIKRQITVSVLSYAFPITIAGNADVTSLEDRWTPFMLDFAEIFLLLHTRRLSGIQTITERLRAKRQEIMGVKSRQKAAS